MKKWLILIFIYIVSSLMISAITAVPQKIDEKALDNRIQYHMNHMVDYEEEILQNIPEEIKEEARKGAADNIRRLYEYKNSFSYRFTRNLEASGIGLLILIVMIVCIRCSRGWRRRWL